MTADDSSVKPRPLCLDQFLKLSSLVESGGQAKVLIQGGQVQVNGQVETRRRRKLVATDIVQVGDETCLVRDFASFA